MDHSGSPETQANSDGNPHGRRTGDGGDFGAQMGADGGRWCQILGNGAKFGHKKGRRLPPCSLIETWIRRPAAATTPKTSAQTVAHFAKPARKPRRERAESQKTIRKTAQRTFKTLNKGPNFRMVDTYGTPFLFDCPSCAPAWHYLGGNPRLVRKQRDCSRNHPRRPLARARLGSGAPQARWPAADSAPLAYPERSTGKEREGRPPSSPGTPGRTVRRGCVRSRSGGHHQKHRLRRTAPGRRALSVVFSMP